MDQDQQIDHGEHVANEELLQDESEALATREELQGYTKSKLRGLCVAIGCGRGQTKGNHISHLLLAQITKGQVREMVGKDIKGPKPVNKHRNVPLRPPGMVDKRRAGNREVTLKTDSTGNWYVATCSIQHSSAEVEFPACPRKLRGEAAKEWARNFLNGGQ